MSTRANVIVTDANGDSLIFYRHSDGYPEGTLPSLVKFLDLVKTGKIRDNVGQASGWLILLGRQEDGYGESDTSGYSNWKIGAYEPTPYIHSDIEYAYLIDLESKTIHYSEYSGTKTVKDMINKLRTKPPSTIP